MPVHAVDREHGLIIKRARPGARVLRPTMTVKRDELAEVGDARATGQSAVVVGARTGALIGEIDHVRRRTGRARKLLRHRPP